MLNVESQFTVNATANRLEKILDEKGMTIFNRIKHSEYASKIGSATVVLADENEFSGMNEEWLKWFPVNPPARQGAKLPAKISGLKVSIAAIAEA